MEPLPRLQARIASLGELRDLVGALRGLSGVHLQEAQETLTGIRNYVDIVGTAIAEAAALLPETTDRTDEIAEFPGDAADGVLIVVCSEHGFTGAFNEHLFDRAAAERRPDQKIAVIGRRGTILADERNIDIEWTFAMATHAGGVLNVTRRVAERIADARAVDIVFASYRKGGAYEIEAKRILPLDPALLDRAAGRSPPLHHMPAELLLVRLASEYLFAEITHAVMESLASENAARLQVMEAADRNIGDKLEQFHRTEHTVRQETITAELLELVTGSEAVLGNGNW